MDGGTLQVTLGAAPGADCVGGWVRARVLCVCGGGGEWLGCGSLGWWGVSGECLVIQQS